MSAPDGVSSVTARIATIERRFAPRTPAFAESLRAASAQPPSPAAATPIRARSESAVVTASAGTGRAQPPTSAVPPAGGPPAGSWAQALPPAGRAWAPAIERAALRAGVDPALLGALVWAESGFEQGAVSHAGAIGLAQLMPATAAGLGVDPHDPEQNLDGGARYLAEQLRRFGSPELALAAYNAGPGRVSSAGGIPPIAETQAYVPKVLGYHQRLGGTS